MRFGVVFQVLAHVRLRREGGERLREQRVERGELTELVVLIEDVVLVQEVLVEDRKLLM